jgi:hypothetical protein
MRPEVTTDDLLHIWREAENALVDVDRDTLTWRVGRVLANQAWEDYRRRLDEERDAIEASQQEG